MQNNLTIILILLVFAILIFFIFRRTNIKHKPTTLKKYELIKKYEYEMLKLINKYEKDRQLMQEKKIEFLKVTSYELHNNIFFEKEEAKAIIKKLASM